MTHLFPGPIVPAPGLTELDARARDIFRRDGCLPSYQNLRAS